MRRLGGAPLQDVPHEEFFDVLRLHAGPLHRRFAELDCPLRPMQMSKRSLLLSTGRGSSACWNESQPIRPGGGKPSGVTIISAMTTYTQAGSFVPAEATKAELEMRLSAEERRDTSTSAVGFSASDDNIAQGYTDLFGVLQKPTSCLRKARREIQISCFFPICTLSIS